MNIVERLKGILLSPKTEWPKIAAEPMTAQGIYTGWVMILAAIGPLAVLLAGQGLVIAIGQYLMVLAVTALVAMIVDALAPSFGGEKDFVERAQALGVQLHGGVRRRHLRRAGSGRRHPEHRWPRSTPGTRSISAPRC